MEISRKPIIILDACTIVNLVNAEIESGSDIITRRLQKESFQLSRSPLHNPLLYSRL
ncbi:MAG: hypothetical protein GY795_46430 [Desulfobacterales bacterium]|nr:hypothetical protein [Desulfobacterales bacterium]